MSQKWRHNRDWDDRHLTGALLPVKWVLRALSSIWLAVGLLVYVALYGILASVPVGMLAQIPTYLFYFVTIVVSGVLAAAVPVVLGWLATRKGSRAVRFAVVFPLSIAGFVAGVWAWSVWAWPLLHWDPASNRGVMLLADFVKEYRSTTIRRLPGVEMTELEFYAWWPLRLPLALFVVNMVTATVRRIDFNFKNVGVLTVHTGIVLISLGSLYYGRLKKEGDTILFTQAAAHVTGEAFSEIGPPMGVFFDNTRLALYAHQGSAWESRGLSEIPRYNDYNLGLSTGVLASEVGKWTPKGKDNEGPSRDLSIEVGEPDRDTRGGSRRVDPAVKLRVVGYANYANERSDWVKVEDGEAVGKEGTGGTPEPRGDEGKKQPLRFVFLHGPEDFDKGGPILDRAVWSAALRPMMAPDRIGPAAEGLMYFEYTLGAKGGMPAERWRDLSEKVPPGSKQALVIEVPRADGTPAVRQVVQAFVGAVFNVAQTGFKVEVRELSPRPTMPIITAGYRGAESSLAVVRITKPDGSAVDRYVYHRFPEINQDLSTSELTAQGMPRRTAADPAIRVAFIESDAVQVYLDEADESGKVRAIVRLPGGDVLVHDEVKNNRLDLAPQLQVRLGERWADSRQVTRPVAVEAKDQDKSAVGTHEHALLAVEVTHEKHPEFRRVVWLPFNRYFFDEEPGNQPGGRERLVELPDGSPLWLSFGRRRWQLPGFMLQLTDFKMISYDHRGAPRDYQATVRVTPTEGADFEGFEHVAKLNEPLMAPFHWDESRAWVSNFFGRLVSGLDPRQFKFSQSGWDREGWLRTQKLVDDGKLDRPRVGFTILHVGNNPGIHIVALGAILMGIGIPWAFYVKPWLVQREKLRIQAQVAAGTYVKPGARVVAVADGARSGGES